MFVRVFLIFAIVPIIEVWLLIKIGRVIGPLPTIVSLLVVSVVGAWLAKSQGLRTVVLIRNELAAGRLPAAHLFDAALILAGAILLLIPGFLTDFIGLFFLIPVSRRLIKKWLAAWLEYKLSKGSFLVRRH